MANDYPVDPQYIPSAHAMWGEFGATCSYCGWQRKFKFMNSMGLRVGDPVPATDLPTDTCNRCKRQTMLLSSAPSPPSPKGPVGFWKMPTD